MSEGKWRVTFRYNGRLTGAAQTSTMVEDRKDIPAKLDEFENEAVRRNGSIFIRGWSVEWVHFHAAPLEGEEQP